MTEDPVPFDAPSPPPPWKPRVTQALLAANVGVFLAMWASGVDPARPTTQALVAWGANDPQAVLGGEWWRLFTSMFLHVGVFHLLMNMWGLWVVGAFLERLVGRPAFLVVYVLSGLVGSIASTATHDVIPSAGASGALFGILGGLVSFTVRRGREWLTPEGQRGLMTRLLFVIGINVALGLTIPGIDNAAHGGGLVGGLAFGAAVSLPLTPAGFRARPRRAAAVAVAGLLAVLGLGFALHLVRPPGHLWSAHWGEVESVLDRADAVEGRARKALADAKRLWDGGLLSTEDFARTIEKEILPEWRKALRSVEGLKDVPGEARSVVEGWTRRARRDEDRLDAALLALRAGKREEAAALVEKVLPREPAGR